MSPSPTSSGIFFASFSRRFGSMAFQREKFMSSRPSFTSLTTSHEIGAILVCHPQTVSFEWQSQHDFLRAASTAGGACTWDSTGGLVRFTGIACASTSATARTRSTMRTVFFMAVLPPHSLPRSGPVVLEEEARGVTPRPEPLHDRRDDPRRAVDDVERRREGLLL